MLGQTPSIPHLIVLPLCAFYPSLAWQAFGGRWGTLAKQMQWIVVPNHSKTNSAIASSYGMTKRVARELLTGMLQPGLLISLVMSHSLGEPIVLPHLILSPNVQSGPEGRLGLHVWLSASRRLSAVVFPSGSISAVRMAYRMTSREVVAITILLLNLAGIQFCEVWVGTAFQMFLCISCWWLTVCRVGC